MTLPYCVYILKCTNSINFIQDFHLILIKEKAHQNGEVNFTKDKLPFELVHVSCLTHKQKAYDFERYLKIGSGIAFRNKRLA